MRTAKTEDAKAITELTCFCFGDAYTTEDEIQSFILNKENRLFVVCDDKGLAGAVLFLSEGRDSYLQDMEVNPQDFERIREGKAVLHHKFSVVREDRRGTGLMTLMLEEALRMLREEGIVGALFVQAWIKQGQIPMEGILERAGYRRYRRQIRPWWKYKDRTCNICGGRCKCDSMVYYKIL
uniref:GNAT family N-acetyltransferase n=1 Tax=Eubacterium cellulosolvens TaxID=29322 RepID=UPI00048A3DF6|nr:GNAT family N-acetyltransferase [[Eubacterium] cellulosolvens]